MDTPCHCTALRQAAATSTARYDAALAPLGIKITMFRLLRRIGATDGASISELADRLNLDRSTLGRNIRVLEKLGLVESAAARDARARQVVLTAEGRRRLQAALPLWTAAQDDLARDLGPDGVAWISRIATRLAPRAAGPKVAAGSRAAMPPPVNGQSA